MRGSEASLELAAAGSEERTDVGARCLEAARAAPDAPTAAAVDALLSEAWRLGASDAHVAPEVDAFRVRLRVDGVLREVARLPREALPLLVQRIKVLAGLLTYRTDVPQDGRVPREKSGGPGELRVSVVPTLHGEKAVLRLLGAAAGPEALDALGWPEGELAALRAALRQPQGLLAFCGPAGSGKTTAIYAALREVVAGGAAGAPRSCVTIEEPVEAALDGVDQTPVDRLGGLDFAAALRALLRQDPEVIFVGEVRDGETAAIAVEAGLTGHLVLTTIHAGGSCEALARLLDLGVEPFALASTLRQVFAQRLVRRTCAPCGGAGGPCCGGTGFRGRLPLVERLELDDELRRAVLERASVGRLEALARRDGWRALADAGAAAVSAGWTTADEVARVLGAP